MGHCHTISRWPARARPSRATRPESGVRWIRSYALAEESGEVGTVCIYEADSPEAIRAHADASDLPVDEIIRVADTVIVRPGSDARHVPDLGPARGSVPDRRRDLDSDHVDSRLPS